MKKKAPVLIKQLPFYSLTDLTPVLIIPRVRLQRKLLYNDLLRLADLMLASSPSAATCHIALDRNNLGRINSIRLWGFSGRSEAQRVKSGVLKAFGR